MSSFGKNVSLEANVIQIIQGYQNKTRKNFSQTLNIIIVEWDKYSVMIQKLKEKQLEQETIGHLKEIKKAKVIKK